MWNVPVDVAELQHAAIAEELLGGIDQKDCVNRTNTKEILH